MRIALNYTGQLRSWNPQCKVNHLENIWSYAADAYFYTDHDPEVIGHFEARVKFTKDQNVNWYPDPFQHHRYHDRKAPENTYYQTMRQWHCGFIGFNLIPQGYDIYVRIRPDIIFNGKLDFHEFDCSQKVIYIPQGNDYWGINDQFAFGNHEVMKIYYSVYQNHHELWHEGTTFCSELMQLRNLEKNGVQIKRFGTPQQQIVR